MRTDRLGIAWLLAFVVLLGGSTPAWAQEPSDTVPADTVEVAEDTVSTAEEPQRADRGDLISVLGGGRTVAADESVNDAVVIGGTLRVRGEVRGDAVVIGGRLVPYEGSVIRGDAVVVGGSISDQGGRILGERVSAGSWGALGRTTERASEDNARAGRARGAGWSRVGRRLAGFASTTGLLLVLAGAGSVLIFYGRRFLETVSDTARRSPLRATAVGLASGILIFPLYIALIVALAISIIGIPLLLVAIPVYPVLVALAIGLGLLGMLHAVGERTVEQRGADPLRYRNAYAYLFVGLAIFFLPILAGHLIGMTGFLGFVGGLLRFLAWLALWIAATVGLGAVVLSRAGTRRTFADSPAGSSASERDPLADDPLADDPFGEDPLADDDPLRPDPRE